jgi:hypothetical protein
VLQDRTGEEYFFYLRADGDASGPPWATTGESWMVTPSSTEPFSERVGVEVVLCLKTGQ